MRGEHGHLAVAGGDVFHQDTSLEKRCLGKDGQAKMGGQGILRGGSGPNRSHDTPHVSEAALLRSQPQFTRARPTGRVSPY